MLTDEDGACCDYTLMASGEVANHDVEMHETGRAGPRRGIVPGALEGQPLAVRRRLQSDPAGIPLHRHPAQQPGPETSQAPRIGCVKHDLADPADRAAALIAHPAMMTDQAQTARTMGIYCGMLPREMPVITHPPVVLRPFCDKDAGLVRSVASDALIPLITTVPANGDPVASPFRHRGYVTAALAAISRWGLSLEGIHRRLTWPGTAQGRLAVARGLVT